jgi:hypothetical protein
MEPRPDVLPSQLAGSDRVSSTMSRKDARAKRRPRCNLPTLQVSLAKPVPAEATDGKHAEEQDRATGPLGGQVSLVAE